MRSCKECGTSLPDQARFCLQCGTPVEQPGVLSQGAPPKLDFIQPAISGGMFLGFLSSIPFINAGNYLCCMWVLGGGALGAFMLSKQSPGRITFGDGAFVGVLSGLVGAVITTMVSIPVRLLAPGIFEAQQAAMENMLQQTPEFQGPLRDFLLQMASPEITAITLGFTFVTSVLFYSLFAMIGAILMVAILSRR